MSEIEGTLHLYLALTAMPCALPGLYVGCHDQHLLIRIMQYQTHLRVHIVMITT